MTADLEQKRRTVRVLELLGESFKAHTHGDKLSSDSAVLDAMELDSAAMLVIQGGMMIGEIPNPERDWTGWLEYLAANQEGLARAEAEAAQEGNDDA